MIKHHLLKALVIGYIAWVSQPALCENTSPLTVGGYIDGYFAIDSNGGFPRERAYTTQALYDRELAANLAFVDAKLNTELWRGRIALQTGSSVHANYAAEPQEFWRSIQEAVVGYHLTDDLWIDGGIYLSHIGMESWISRDDWALTRSLISEFSPYYQSGGKISYQMSPELSAQLHLLRGWQNISAQQDLAVGTQISYAPHDSMTLSYNTFVGRQNHGTRIFHDFVYLLPITSALDLGASADFGTQSNAKDGATKSWYGGALLLRTKLKEQLSVTARVERYSDRSGIVAASLTEAPFVANGYSINLDYSVTPRFVIRTECRYLESSQLLFPDRHGNSNHDIVTVVSFSYSPTFFEL